MCANISPQFTIVKIYLIENSDWTTWVTWIFLSNNKSLTMKFGACCRAIKNKLHNDYNLQSDRPSYTIDNNLTLKSINGSIKGESAPFCDVPNWPSTHTAFGRNYSLETRAAKMQSCAQQLSRNYFRKDISIRLSYANYLYSNGLTNRNHITCLRFNWEIFSLIERKCQIYYCNLGQSNAID